MANTRLQETLDTITERTRALVQAERMAPAEQAIAELFASGAEERLLRVGALAPEFVLEDYTGKRVSSADLLAIGPLVLSFFRGRWCPYCIGELTAWGELYEPLRRRGAMVVGISPQTVRQNEFTADQHEVRFPLLSDPELRVAESFGLAFDAPDYLQRYLKSILVNVPYVNGTKSWRLQVPATFVLGQDGRVLYARGYADWRVRPEPDEVLAVLPAS